VINVREPVIEFKQISLEPCDPEQNRELLYKWFQAPHVAKWWGDADRALEEVRCPAVDGGNAFIAVNSAFVGYVRWQVPSRAELEAAGLHDIPENAVDIDIAIGEPDYMGRGVAPHALQLLVQFLFSTTKAPLIMMCTSVDNHRAIRAFKKAGFKRVRMFQDPGYGSMWLLTVKRGI